MFVFGGFGIVAEIVMPLHFTDDGNQVNGMGFFILVKGNLTGFFDFFTSMLFFVYLLILI